MHSFTCVMCLQYLPRGRWRPDPSHVSTPIFKWHIRERRAQEEATYVGHIRDLYFNRTFLKIHPLNMIKDPGLSAWDHIFLLYLPPPDQPIWPRLTPGLTSAPRTRLDMRLLKIIKRGNRIFLRSESKGRPKVSFCVCNVLFWLGTLYTESWIGTMRSYELWVQLGPVMRSEMRSKIEGDTNMVSTDPPVYKYPLSPAAINDDSSLLG